MNNNMRELIDKFTKDLIDVLDIQIPININDITEIVVNLGGEICNCDLYEDRVEKVGDSFIIYVSDEQDEKRKNFTIAHELGHLFLHMGYLIDRELWEDNSNIIYRRLGASEMEYQANEFAASLLMPKNEYERVMLENIEGNKVKTENIAEYFNVSVETASNRGKILGFLEW